MVVVPQVSWPENAGRKRYFKDFKKSQAILRRYKAISLEEETNPSQNIGKYFDLLMFGMTKIGENWIQGGAVLGQMTQEEFDAHDENGNLTKPAELHDALYFAKNREKLMNQAYNRGYADKVEADDKLSKNIQPDNIRQVNSIEGNKMTFRVVEP